MTDSQWPAVVFEDESVMVVNKPCGWVVNQVESTSAPVVAVWVREKFGLKDLAFGVGNKDDFYGRAGIVHRLDKETSGLLLVAKTPQAFDNLTGQFAQRMVKKKYLALVHGKIALEGLIEGTVGRLPWNRERFGVFSGGRVAKTTYRVLGYYSYPDFRARTVRDGPVTRGSDKFGGLFSYLELVPETGRTHQIRVHLKSVGHPVVADEFYAGRKTSRDDRLWCPRLFLHAAFLGFYHPPDGGWREFSVDLPAELASVLESLVELSPR